MKLISKRFLPYALVGTMMLAGCGNNVENKEQTLVEPTTTATTEEYKEEIPEVAETTKEATKDYYALAADSYNRYTDFYAFTNLAYEDENGNVNIDRIENSIKVINGEVADLTSSEVSSAVKNIEWIVYPEYIGKKINFNRTNAYEYLTDEKDLDVLRMVSMDAPKLSEYVTDEETKAAALEYEALMDKIVAEMNESYDSISEETIQEIKAIMDMCVSLFNQASYQYENFNIRDAIKTLCKSIKGFDGLKQTIINKKTSFNSLLPKIISLRNKAFSNLQEYRINIYILINLKFRPVQYNGVDTLVDFCKRYILTEPFISFDDIYDPAADQNKKLKFVMNEYFKKGQRMGYKNLLLYGPKGSGKTLAVHALAYDLKGKVAQIEGMELFKIPYFAKEFVKAAFTYMQFKPLIVYIKNMESMFSNMNNFNFIYDRASSSSLENIIFIASTTVPIQKLPKDISKKFHYSHCIRPVDKNQKINIINYISQKIGIKINMSEQDLNSFAFQNLGNYSNEDIFNLIKTAIELKQKEIGDDQENKVYKQGISEKEMLNALNSVKGSLTAEAIKTYYL